MKSLHIPKIEPSCTLWLRWGAAPWGKNKRRTINVTVEDVHCLHLCFGTCVWLLMRPCLLVVLLVQPDWGRLKWNYVVIHSAPREDLSVPRRPTLLRVASSSPVIISGEGSPLYRLGRLRSRTALRLQRFIAGSLGWANQRGQDRRAIKPGPQDQRRTQI